MHELGQHELEACHRGNTQSGITGAKGEKAVLEEGIAGE